MTGDEHEVRRQVLALLESLHISDEAPAVLRAAARTVADVPPHLESAEETERSRHIREMLGVKSAEEQLTAMLVAREVLESLAEELGTP
jgi:hypothetical protein